MALFQKKLDTSSSAPLYTLNSSKTVLVIGLGNVGVDYNNTRHNVGFAALDDFAGRNDFPEWINKKDLNCYISLHNLGATRVILCKPATMMNNSGQAASAIQKFYRIYNNETLVVYDELAIEFGQIRTRQGGETAGHNGVKSLVQYIGDDFGRLRIGIANEFNNKADAGDFVLGKFTREEQVLLPSILKESGVIITEYVYSGELPHQTRSI